MLGPALRRNAAASMRSCRWRGLCADCFKGQRELPYRQIPWALPFQISKAEATAAFHSWLSTDLHRLAELSVFAVRPVYVPYYVFVGQLKATFDGVVAYGDKEYALRGIKCPAVHLGADAGRTTGVYAGFDYRRKYVRTALPGDLTVHPIGSLQPLIAMHNSLCPQDSPVLHHVIQTMPAIHKKPNALDPAQGLMERVVNGMNVEERQEMALRLVGALSAGDMLWVEGASGCGKSTLVD